MGGLQSESIRSVSRLVAFCSIVAFMVTGPIYRQVLGGEGRHFRSWVMFSGIGVGVIDARYYLVDADKPDKQLNHLEILDGEYVRSGRSNVWLTKRSTGGPASVVRMLCRKLAPGASIRVSSRVATRRGWVREPNDRKIVSCPSK